MFACHDRDVLVGGGAWTDAGAFALNHKFLRGSVVRSNVRTYRTHALGHHAQARHNDVNQRESNKLELCNPPIDVGVTRQMRAYVVREQTD